MVYSVVCQKNSATLFYGQQRSKAEVRCLRVWGGRCSAVLMAVEALHLVAVELVVAADERLQQLLQHLGPHLPSLQDLLVVGLLLTAVVQRHLVGDERDAKDPQAGVLGHRHLRNRAHAWGMGWRRERERGREDAIKTEPVKSQLVFYDGRRQAGQLAEPKVNDE